MVLVSRAGFPSTYPNHFTAETSNPVLTAANHYRLLFSDAFLGDVMETL
jgi:hypothetical protein